MDKDISERISITRYFMVIGIIVLHIPPYQPLDALDGSSFEYIKAFFAHGVFRATVPVLTAISGYLVFKSGLHLKPKKLVIKKTQSVFVPLVLWNLPFAIVLYFIQKYGVLSYDFHVNLNPITFKGWSDAVVGLTGSPINYPLNFLRDLFVVSLLAPFFWLLLKRIPYWGVLVVFAVFFWNLDGPIVIRNTMLLSFYTGALAATQEWNLRALDKFAWPLLLVFIAICVAIVAVPLQNREFLRLLSPFLVWPMMSLLMNTAIGDWLRRNARHSFFTFLSHGPIVLVFWLIYLKLPLESLYALYWIATPIITVLLAIFLNNLFKRWMPGLASIMLGNR